ncbi:hypothetical protein [Varibaculum vaginae]|uniref:hypothetical protein n=1 Tax=Varibaculum vaginae TaxID=2364797 RepID=UPI000F074788|nr:hypothetical protein [Varibaculum vaginae]
MTYEAQPAEEEVFLENNPDSKHKKSGLIVTIAIGALVILALVGVFIANTLVAKAEQSNLKANFTNAGFSKVQTEINSSPMLLSYLKGYYRHAKVTAAAGTLSRTTVDDKKDQSLKIKDMVLDVYGLSRGDNPSIEKGSASFTVPGAEFDKQLSNSSHNSGLNIKRNGNQITAESNQDGLKLLVTMTLHFKPAEKGKSGKLMMTTEKISVNGSDELLGQKLTPADIGMKPEEEIPLGFAEGTFLKNIEFSGNDIKYVLAFNNLTLSDLT